MRASITKIGNSNGVIIPAHLLKLCGFEDEVLLQVKNEALIISKAKKPRENWVEAFKKTGAGEEKLLLDQVSNDFDEEEWTW